MAEPSYSPRLRTAVVLCGAGTAGVYQAGVLRALTEAGVKIDLLAAHGVGVITALCCAIDGGGRLWDPEKSPWMARQLRLAYGWRPALRAAGIALAAAGVLLLSPILVLAFAAAVYAFSLIAGLAGAASLSVWFVELYRRTLTVLFQPPFGPTVIARGVVLIGLVVLGILCVAAFQAVRHDRGRRRWRGAFWWRVLGAPIDPDEPETTLVATLWELVRGSSTAPQPTAADIGRRYVDVLAENIGQPGFRELLIGVHDIDARRDLIGGVLAPDARAAFGARRTLETPREAEVADFVGVPSELLVDFLKGALRLPVVAAPHLCPFPADGYWRGEAHRLCDRPELVARLIEEIAIVGIEQVVLVSAAEPPAAPHGMRSTPLDFRGRAGELLRSIETSAVQDAWTAAASRFSGVFTIRPDHNPVGPFAFAGAYDQSSDRVRTLSELLKQGYEDTYRQFIEPVVAAGEKIDAI